MTREQNEAEGKSKGAMAEDPSSMLSLVGVGRRFGHTVAVNDVNLDIPRGEFLTLLGPSGSGKSTTLYMIAGFDDPTEGDVKIQDETVIGLTPNRRNIGMVFQRYSLFPTMTVRENIAFPLSVRKVAKNEIKERVDSTLQLVQLSDYAERKPSALSGGQQQRVALARALVYEPRILLMDEPLSALDRKLRENLQQEIRSLHERLDVTIVYVTHDQEEALHLSDRIAVYNHGKIVQIGTGEDLYHDPADSFVASFIGASNFAIANVESVNGEYATVSLPGAEGHIRVPSCDGLSEAANALIMVRPERVTLRRELPGHDRINAVRAKIREVVFLGDNITYKAEMTDGTEFTVKETSHGARDRTFSADDDCYLTWKLADTHVFDEWDAEDIQRQLA